MTKSPIFLIVGLIMLLSLVSNQNPQPVQQTLNLGQLMAISQVQPGYTYYSVNFESNAETPPLILITVQSDQQDSISIYTSISYQGVDKFFQYPNYENNTLACTYSSIDTCALSLPTVNDGKTFNVTVYIGVQVFFTNKLTILATLEELYPAKIGIKYDIDFHTWESAILTLSGEQINQYEQVVIIMQYDAFQDLGKFALYAGLNKIPTSWENRIQSRLMGAFSQILVLDPIQNNQTYYIVLEGQLGTQFDVSFKAFSLSSPKLEMNDTIFYYSTSTGGKKDELSFQISINYQEQDDVLPLFVDLNTLAGYGQFQIDYCDGLTNFTFTNINGQSGQVIIPAAQRKQCYQIIFNNGGLMVENLIVTIRNVAWYFAYSIGVFQGQFPLILSPYSQKMGTLLSEQDTRVHQIEGYINQSFVLKYKTISGQSQLNFTLFQCKQSLFIFQKCTKLLNSNQNSTIDQASPQYSSFNFTSLQRRFYKIQIGHNSLQKFDSEYVLLLLPLKQRSSVLTPSKPIMSIISQNQYQYYLINLTYIQKQTNITIDNQTNIVITMIQTNGDCLLLTSLAEKQPKYDQVFEINSTVDYSWNGRRQFNVGPDTQAIYIGILGASQSLYHLQVTIDVNQDIPERYTKLVSDKLLSYALSSEQKQDHVLLSYTAHSIPYTIIISPTPSCIIYSYTLPITEKTCRQLPSEITEKVIYLKVYRNSTEQQTQDDTKEFKFTVYVYSGSHYLFQYTPVLIACQDTCYEYVTVYVPQKIKIVHRGMGFIGHKDSNESFSNQKMQLMCEKSYPCFLTINASLPWGGDMELFYDSADIQEIQWITKPLTFESAYDPKYFYMQIRSWNSINTAIFYTQGISVSIYYNIYSMRQNATNALQYGFPSSYFYMKKSEGNPLRRFHIVQFDQDLIQKLGCKDQNDLCIATLAVYPNNNVEYSSGYIKNSIGYFSCNTFRYYVPMNSPYQLSEEYSLIYFTHSLSQNQLNNLAPFYYVKVQPLSSCRPQIFAPFSQISNNGSYDSNTPFYGNYQIDSKTINMTRQQIQFTISTDTPCAYMMWLLDNDVQPIMSNINYELISDQNGNVVVVFSDKYLWNDRKFSINFDQQMNEIIVDKYQTNPNGSIKYPTAESYMAYASQTHELKYSSAQFTQTLYIIKASTNVKSKVNLKISTNEFQTVLLTNQQTRFTFSQQKSSFSFRYFSNNDFLMFAATDSGSIKVTVTDYKRDDDRNVIETYINDNSDPWIKVNAVRGDIRQYIITLENVLFSNQVSRNLQQTTKYPKINLHVEESGTIGLPQLYDGVALFDAFYQQDSQNCYKYVSDHIVGRPSLTVDLIFGSEFINKLPVIRSRLSLSQGGKINSTWARIPTGYRLTSEFYGNQQYEFCFSINDQPGLVSKQYYIMIENIEYSLRHLTLDVPMSSNSPALYQIYQYVATQNQNLMIQVVNCFGKSTLLGAKQYSDIYLGQVSQLGSFYRDQTKSIAQKQLQMGYFYFGIKLNDENDRYKIRVQLLQQNEKIHYDRFQLKQKLITKAKSVEQNGKKTVRVSLPKVSFLSLPQDVKVHHISYNLFVDNLKDNQQYSSNAIAKCPVLANRNMSSYKFTQSYTENVKAETAPSDEVVIDIPISQVPDLFNLTGYVEVSITEPYTQTLTYYYESNSFKLKNTHEGKGVSAFTVIFIICMIIGSLLVVYVVYKRWRQRKQKAKIAFEMATYNHEYQSNTGNTNQMPQQIISTQSSPSKSLRKALNQNVGYGEFVDQNL